MKWCNNQDELNLARGIEAQALMVLKQAANRARNLSPAEELWRYTVSILPHTKGEVLLSHHTGWQGRGIAWHQYGTLIALVWDMTSGR